MKLNKKFLATTGISEMWDLSAVEMLFLAPWCLSKKENMQLAQRIPHSVIPSPWTPAIKIKEAADCCYKIYEEILPELSVKLNLMHSVSYPDRYWRVLVGPWLLHFIEIFYERYNRIENVFDLFPDAYTFILPESLCNLSSVDTYDFVSIKGKATQDYYNLKLFSLIMRYMYPHKTVEKNMCVPPMEFRIFPDSSASKKLFYGVKIIKDAFLHPDIILSDMYHSNWAQMVSLEFGFRRNSILFKYFSNVRAAALNKYAQKERRKFRLSERFDKFQSLLYSLIPDAIPMCYVENFRKYKDKVKIEKVKAVGSAVGWYFNEDFKFFAAESTLKGAKIIDFQHGGGYGTFLSSPVETISLEKDIFYTWGWRADNSCRTIPLADPYLSRLKDTHKVQKNQVLFIGAIIHKYLCRFSSTLTPDDIPQYFLNKKKFFYCLDKLVQNKFLYRPYNEIGWNEVMLIKEMMPEVKIISEGRLVNLMRQAEIVVIDYLGTTNLEAMIINVPTVWFWDSNVILIRPEAERYFDLLRDVGVLYNSPEEAARKVNEINDDPLGWWRDSKIQKARDLFCSEFALTSNNWRKEWIDALNVYR